MSNPILESCGLSSDLSSGRLMQWVGVLTVLGMWVLENIVALISHTIAFFKILFTGGTPSWTFTLIDLVTIAAMVGTLIAGATVQKFSKNDVPTIPTQTAQG